MSMVYLDLAELPAVLGMSRWWGRSWWKPVRFVREDYLRPPAEARAPDLDASVRALVLERLGRSPAGPIRVLTHPRMLGYVFNPVTFYYCFDAQNTLDAVVAEITNTPWNERHAYVLDARTALGGGAGRPLRWRFGKEFHVSPFLPMGLEYDWTFSTPGEGLLVHMNVRDTRGGAAKVFDATLTLRREEMSAAAQRRFFLRFPFRTFRVIAGIYWQALRLRLKRAAFYPHPKTHQSSPADRRHPTGPTQTPGTTA
jgi:hypothetical protein